MTAAFPDPWAVEPDNAFPGPAPVEFDHESTEPTELHIVETPDEAPPAPFEPFELVAQLMLPAPVEATARLDESPSTPDAEQEGASRRSRTRTDDLTGLPNLAMLYSFLWLQVQQRLRHELPDYLGLIMIDIDDLNRFNETHGDAAVDRVVQSVSGVLEQAARESDLLVRHSGGTFCVVVSYATPETLALAGERLRAYVENHEIDLGDLGKRHVTASFGCAWLPDVRASDHVVLELLDAADAQLAWARTGGGNQVAVAPDTAPPVSPVPQAEPQSEPVDHEESTATGVAARIAALREEDRAVWATVFYAGLRPGELSALRAEDVDLEASVLRVERNRSADTAKPKKRAGRVIPILAPLQPHLAARKLGLQDETQLFFGEGDETFDRNAVERRAAKAWRKDELGPLELSDGRDTFAQLMIEAGVNARTLCGYLGHSSIETTFERYGHLMHGNEHDAPAMANAYLERTTAAEVHAPLSGEFTD